MGQHFCCPAKLEGVRRYCRRTPRVAVNAPERLAKTGGVFRQKSVFAALVCAWSIQRCCAIINAVAEAR